MKMPKISPAVRVSFGLVMFTLSVLLIADLFGIIPKKHEMAMDARKKVSESIAVQLSIAATKSDKYIIEQTLEHLVKRNDDVLGAQLSRANGELISGYGKFDHLMAKDDTDTASSENIVIIPIFAGDKRWGSVKIEYASLYQEGLWAFFTDTVAGMLIFVGLASIGGYIFILRKALHVLDPKTVVPERVKSAFNALAEGVLILDDKEQIMMANDAFAEHVDKDPDRLVGAKASDLKWKVRKNDRGEGLPWVNSLEDGTKQIGIAMNLSTPHKGVRAMSTNSAPILDDKGEMRGALVTFDDITDVEESNILLENAVDNLQKNDAEIRRKNKELEVLASRDALTGCYNRRAFFDLVEGMYQQADRTNTEMVCIMSDIDHFKSINDKFGHTVGDEALRMVSEVLNGCDHEGAIIGRYGGEEFCIGLPNAGLNEGLQVAEELRKSITAASADFCDEDLKITASFGVSSIDESMGNFSILLEEADKALYLAKESGRDRVVSFADCDAVGAKIQTGMNYSAEVAHVRVHTTDDSAADDSAADGSATDVSATDDSDDQENQMLHQKIYDLEEELRKEISNNTKQSFNDPITELPTRIIFEDRVSQAMAYSARAETVMSVAILNIDMFSRINDTLGQVVGDEFLKTVGQRLKTILRRSDTVASMVAPGQAGPSLSRLHDDEFALLLTGMENIESLTYVIKRIQEKFSGKINVADNELFVTTTTGLSLYPTDGATAKELIENARSAQKHARGLVGRNNYQFYSQEINQKIVDQMRLEIDMNNAIEKSHFKMVYQPKLDMKTGQINSMEALVRWEHPEKGLVMPFRFIPAAEKTGLIVEIGKWCLNTVCKQAKAWVGMGLSDLRVSVNISAIEFAEEGFVATVLDSLKNSGLDAQHLELELTETTVMSNLTQSCEIIDDLRYRGVTVTLDDFGTGYSSFNYLGHLNFDWIKIDRSFLIDALKHDRSSTLYAGMVSMSRAIGLRVVSEGIENQTEYNYVKKMGVDEMQGFMLGKPMEGSAMTRTLMSHDASQRKKAV